MIPVVLITVTCILDFDRDSIQGRIVSVIIDFISAGTPGIANK